MDRVMTIITLFIGAFMLYSSYKLTKSQDLSKLYDESVYRHIPKKHRQAFAKEIGRAIGYIGYTLILSSVFFFFSDTTVQIIGMVILLTGMLVSCFLLYRANQKYKRS